MVGWGLDSCCVHKEVPIVRVGDGESGASWTGFGNSGTIALELPSGMINDSIGGLPIHETGGWFEDVAWSPDGQVLFAAGAALSGNVFQRLSLPNSTSTAPSMSLLPMEAFPSRSFPHPKTTGLLLSPSSRMVTSWH